MGGKGEDHEENEGDRAMFYTIEIVGLVKIFSLMKISSLMEIFSLMEIKCFFRFRRAL